jgi:hypothetical protein
MALHEETAMRLKELLRGQQCCKCRHPAQRYWRQKHFCHDCFPARSDATVRVHRTFLFEGK